MIRLNKKHLILVLIVVLVVSLGYYFAKKINTNKVLEFFQVRCGPHDGKKCGGSQCCSSAGWCYGTIGVKSNWCHDKTNNGFNYIGTQGGKFDGDKPPVGAILYQHGNFTGWKINFPVGRFKLTDIIARGGRNDDASSIKVMPGYRATVYHGDFGGDYEATFTAGDYNMQAFLARGARNDDISSIIVERVFKRTSSNAVVLKADPISIVGNVVNLTGLHIRCNHNGYNIQAHNNGGVHEHPNHKGWESFTVLRLNDSRVAFLTWHGTYLEAPKPELVPADRKFLTRTGSKNKIANYNSSNLKQSKLLTEDCKFSLVANDDSKKTLSIKTNHGTYLRSSNRTGGRINQQTFIGSWEKFKFTKGQRDHYATSDVIDSLNNAPKIPKNINDGKLYLDRASVGASLKEVVFAENSRGDLHFWGVNPSSKIYYKTVPNGSTIDSIPWTQLRSGLLTQISIGIDAEDNQYLYGTWKNANIYRLIIKKGENPNQIGYVTGKSLWQRCQGRSRCVSVAVSKDGTQHLWCVGMDTHPWQVTVTNKNSRTVRVKTRWDRKSRDRLIWIANKLNSFGNESVLAVDKSKSIVKWDGSKFNKISNVQIKVGYHIFFEIDKRGYEYLFATTPKGELAFLIPNYPETKTRKYDNPNPLMTLTIPNLNPSSVACSLSYKNELIFYTANNTDKKCYFKTFDLKDINAPEPTLPPVPELPPITTTASPQIVALNCDQNFKPGGTKKMDCIKQCMLFKDENGCNFDTCFKICDECTDGDKCAWMKKEEEKRVVKCAFSANSQNLGTTREECAVQCGEFDVNCSQTECKNLCNKCSNEEQCNWIKLDKELEALNDTINVPSKPQLTAIPGDRRIVLKWRVDNNGGSEITKFLVIIYKTNDSNSKMRFEIPKPESDRLNRYTYVITDNLENEVAYTVSVIAINKKGYSDISNIEIVKPYEFLSADDKLSDSGETLLQASSVIQSERDSIIANLVSNIETGDNVSVQENLEKIQELKQQIVQPEFDKESFLRDRDIRINFT